MPFARACRMPVSLGETTTTRATCGSMILAISHALPVTTTPPDRSWSGFARTLRARAAALRSGARDRALQASAIAISQKSRCTSNPIALTPRSVRGHHRRHEKPWAKRHRRIRARRRKGRKGRALGPLGMQFQSPEKSSFGAAGNLAVHLFTSDWSIAVAETVAVRAGECRRASTQPLDPRGSADRGYVRSSWNCPLRL